MVAHVAAACGRDPCFPVMNQIDRRLPDGSFQRLAPTSGQAFLADISFQLSHALAFAAARVLLIFVASLGFFITPALGGRAPRDANDRPVDHPADQRTAETGSSAVLWAAILLISAVCDLLRL